MAPLSPQIEEFLYGLDFGADLDPQPEDPDDNPNDEWEASSQTLFTPGIFIK